MGRLTRARRALQLEKQGPGTAPAPLIERMFRGTWFLATEKRDAMVHEGSEEEVNALVAEGGALHDKLRRGSTG